MGVQLVAQQEEQQVGQSTYIAIMSFTHSASANIPFKVCVPTGRIVTLALAIQPQIHLTRLLQYETFFDITNRLEIILKMKRSLL